MVCYQAIGKCPDNRKKPPEGSGLFRIFQGSSWKPKTALWRATHSGETANNMLESRAEWAPPPILEELAGGDTGLVGELIVSFTTDSADRLQRIRNAMAASNAPAVGREAHAIKGSARQMAADRVASLCERIEAACQQQPVSQLGDMVRELERRINEVCEAMAMWGRLSTPTSRAE